MSDRIPSREERREELRRMNAEREAAKSGGFGDMMDLLDMSGFNDIPVFKLKEGNNYLDVIPYVVTTNKHPQGLKKGMIDYKLEVYAHRNVGPNKKVVICLNRTFGENCPLCELRERLLNEGTSKDDQKIKDLNATCRNFYNVLDVGDNPESDDMQIFENPASGGQNKWFEALVAAEAKAAKEDVVIVHDIEEGFTIKVRGSMETFKKGEFVKPDKVDLLNREPYNESIMEECYPLEAMLKHPTYDEVAELMGNMETENPEKDERSSRSRGGRRSEVAGRRPRESSESEKQEKSERSRGRREEPKEESTSRSNRRSSQAASTSSGRRRERSAPEPEPEEQDPLENCPSGHVFGSDFNKTDACVDCEEEIFQRCGDVYDRMKDEEEQAAKQEPSKKETSRRSRR